MPRLDMVLPIEEAVKAPVVVAVPVKGVCSWEMLCVRSVGAGIDVFIADSDATLLFASLACFFGEAATRGSELNELTRMRFFQSMSAQIQLSFQEMRSSSIAGPQT
jgi:hypothetical protein